jgi:hypothetical protein
MIFRWLLLISVSFGLSFSTLYRPPAAAAETRFTESIMAMGRPAAGATWYPVSLSFDPECNHLGFVTKTD